MLFSPAVLRQQSLQQQTTMPQINSRPAAGHTYIQNATCSPHEVFECNTYKVQLFVHHMVHLHNTLPPICLLQLRRKLSRTSRNQMGMALLAKQCRRSGQSGESSTSVLLFEMTASSLTPHYGICMLAACGDAWFAI
jgi:hypothetical protein